MTALSRLAHKALPSTGLLLVWLIGCRGSGTARTGQLGDACDINDETFCRFGLVCQETSGTCQAEEHADADGAGEECRNNNDCTGDTLCQERTNTCQILEDDDPGIPGPALLGNACAVDEDCIDELICQFASGTCQFPGGEDIEGIGRSCITNGDCGLGELICQGASNTCQRPEATPAED